MVTRGIELSTFLDDVLPLVALALGEDVPPHLLYKFNHLQLVLHLAAAGEDAPDALLRGEEVQRFLADALVGLAVVEEEHEAEEGGHAGVELVQVRHLVLI